MPAGHNTGRSRRSTQNSPRARRRAERRRRLRRTLICSAAVLAVAVGVTAYATTSDDDATVADGRKKTAAQPNELDGETSGGGDPSAQGGRRSPSPAPPSTAPASPSANPSSPAATSTAPARPGVFTSSAAAGGPQGKGTVRRWRVEVEEGSGVDADGAAKAVEAILGHPRGWTNDPAYGFQLAGPGQPVDFTVKIATPTTTDRLCEVVTPELIGETNCRAGHTVVVNLKRWQEGSPQFKGPVEEYRALIVNHEVGHEIGHDHETCPGPGKPAPAMMQQIKGLHGCKANAWPYDEHGTYLSGPHVP
ncbi:DUF3152 domain-containing protein [Streptomyces sp. NPDC096339]|uniref:DUF3152 domain-containing protein n=1 Tax=Streptomyces sp. NPDC096339 TaxID=3366086 RepID=UPI00381E0E7A